MRLDQTREYILEELENKSLGKCYYHGLKHSLEVEQACISISESEISLNEKDIELLRVAALTHDIGHFEKMEDHEVLGCDFVLKFMPKFGYNQEEISVVTSLILATKFPHKPSSLLENIICDADLSYLGNGDYYSQAKKLKNELVELHEYKLDLEKDWINFQIDFLDEHSFFTNYAKNNFDPNKNKIIDELKTKLTLL